MKVNARLTGEAENQFAYLKDHTDLTQSDIVKEGINLLFQKQLKPQKRPVDIFKKNFETLEPGRGDCNLSTDYKQMIGDSLNEKYNR
ncbi:MAG: hypothetical protein GY786_24180 [Proteobacteria bacterium]|nr:hypothetical protein [Pseudomonadota bacterium]